ncbi:HNH endonuclease family protein [Microterricola pindariensis]|uniref:GmrSD restriction endonucleases C-terminal domain-containing protein n=1 Tax=Microterricola pindariensis TaxID=478010 RepID=A0ABX5AXK0_9MICO|nr:HNH endonuclease family protein [Microterricola pindariensis]PPL19605.1 hypothetical protein GY24_05305 [Microterricola pindariensis]
MSTRSHPRRTPSKKRRTLAGWAALPVLFAIGIAAVTALTGPDEITPGAEAAPPAASGTALAQLDTLPVKGRAPKTGYDRTESFGTAWRDVDQNGCDTRNDVLARDLTGIDRPAGCRVLSGRLADPYTDTTIDFVRGQGTSQDVQIDHVVALMNAWETGAQKLTVEQRTALANDPLNLLAVEGRANSQKGAGDAATWLPPNKGYRCEYVARQVAVKSAYNLWVTQAEHDAIAGVLASCPAQAVPAA